ncbi:MAG: nitrate/nitrite transporter NrtS [Sphingomonadales bacterium]|nr:nitrate/nitrite transporter NrtS [Sphingomonadales bacterium]MDE2568007.1 nitrate/nitrite transporter NrtS [Sphingomonadales bacterium]
MVGPPDRDRRRGHPMGLIAAMFERTIVLNAFKVSLFVGTCLNAINLGPALWRGEPIAWGKFALNYVVPFLVSSYSAAKVERPGGA